MFQPGQSGNPGGRAKGKPWRDALLRAVLRREPLDMKDNPQRLDVLAEALVLRAIADDTAAAREIGERLDGKVPQAVVGDDEEPPVRVQLIELVAVTPPDESSS